MINDFLINVFAGVFLTVATWVIFNFLMPYYRAWMYDAPNISGTWNFYDVEIDKTKAVGNGTIEQKGELIKATVTRHTSRQGKSVVRTFVYKGKIRSGQLTVSFEETISTGYVVGTLVLKVSSDLKQLSGYTVYLDRDTNEVVTHPIMFCKT